MSSPRLVVDLAAIASNVQSLLANSQASMLTAVVKSNGYGHGAEAVASAALAGGATGIGVTTLNESAQLLHLGVPVLSFSSPAETNFADPATARAEVAVPNLDHLVAVERGSSRSGVRRSVHLFIDTGMSREGCSPRDWFELCENARRSELSGLIEVVGIMGHLGCPADSADVHHREGLDRFSRATRTALDVGLSPRARHLASTAASMHSPDSHHDTLRVGSALIGYDSSTGLPNGLRPAGTFLAPFVDVRRVAAGQIIGYGHGHVAERSGWVGVLPVGYADGIPYRTSGDASVMVRGRLRRLIGYVAMNCAVVDLGNEPVERGEDATIFGPGTQGEPTLADWADWGDTFWAEMLVRIPDRIPRTYINEPCLISTALGSAA